MKRNISISLDSQFESLEDNRVSSDSVRSNLPLHEEERIVLALRKAIHEGFESGMVKGFNPKNHLEKLKYAQRKLNQS